MNGKSATAAAAEATHSLTHSNQTHMFFLFNFSKRQQQNLVSVLQERRDGQTERCQHKMELHLVASESNRRIVLLQGGLEIIHHRDNAY